MIYFGVVWLAVLLCVASMYLNTSGGVVCRGVNFNRLLGRDTQALKGLTYNEVVTKMRGVQEVFRQEYTKGGCAYYAAYWPYVRGSKVSTLCVVFDSRSDRVVSVNRIQSRLRSSAGVLHDVAIAPTVLRQRSFMDRLLGLPKKCERLSAYPPPRCM